LAKRDQQRTLFREAQQKRRQTESLKKRKAKEKRISEAREQAEQAI